MHRALLSLGARNAVTGALLLLICAVFRLVTYLATAQKAAGDDHETSASGDLTETGSSVTAGNIKRIPRHLIRDMGGESTVSELKAFFPGNPDLYYDSRTGEIYVKKPSGGFEKLGENIDDYLPSSNR
jgi:hypothetical protein